MTRFENLVYIYRGVNRGRRQIVFKLDVVTRKFTALRFGGEVCTLTDDGLFVSTSGKQYEINLTKETITRRH